MEKEEDYEENEEEEKQKMGEEGGNEDETEKEQEKEEEESRPAGPQTVPSIPEPVQGVVCSVLVYYTLQFCSVQCNSILYTL